MSKRSILAKNNRKLTPVSPLGDKIFHHLLSHQAKGPFTQAQIVKAIKSYSQSSVSIWLTKNVGRPMEYGPYIYKIEYVDGKYQISRKDKEETAAIRQGGVELEEKKERQRKEQESKTISHVSELAQSKATTQRKAEIITSSVILYGIKKTKRATAKKIVQSHFSQDIIHDVVYCECGLYIILKESNIPSVREQRQNEICQLYEFIVKESEESPS